MPPQLGVSSGTPRPRNDSAASVTMTWANCSVATTTMAVRRLGWMWRTMMRPAWAPSARAASTYSFSRRDSTWAREHAHPGGYHRVRTAADDIDRVVVDNPGARDVLQTRRRGLGVRVFEPIPVGFDGLGGELLTVVEGDVLAELEAPRLVVHRRPRGRQIRRNCATCIAGQQRVIHGCRDAHRDHIVDLVRVHRHHVAALRHDHLTAWPTGCGWRCARGRRLGGRCGGGARFQQ